MQSDKDLKRIPVIEAAQRLGVSVDTIKRRLRSGNLSGQRDNAGKWWVHLTDETKDSHAETDNLHGVPWRASHAAAGQSDPPKLDEQMVADNLVCELRRQNEFLRADISAQQSRHDAEIARRMVERDSLHLGHIERLMSLAAAERSLFLERVDAAELRAETAEARAAAVDQKLHQVLDRLMERQTLATQAPDGLPWWARWFGATRKSDLRR